MKKAISYFMCLCFILSNITITHLNAAVTVCDTYDGSNVDANNYLVYSSLINSYLTTTTDGNLMRVQYGSDIQDGILIEYYDTAYNIFRSRFIEQELPIFGGFYESDNYYFIITGQNNEEKSDAKEVYRITRYDKNWVRLGSDSLYGANTIHPFSAGSLRADDNGRYLIVRTCHEMYTTHQANATIQYDIQNDKITDSYMITMNNDYGYVSHSFNQFVKIVDNKIVAVDHSDSYPRALVLMRYSTDFSDGKFTPGYYTGCINTEFLKFSGNIGNNYTGASAGGFEISDTSYLIAGNSVVQDEQSLSRTTRNIYVAAINKNNAAVQMSWLTNYTEGDGTTSTPHLVKISNNTYMVLWSRGDEVYYTKIDQNGKQVGQIYHMTGRLSDCVPCVNSGKIVWYTWKDNVNTFYDISLSDFSKTNVTEIVNGHHDEVLKVVDGVATIECSACKSIRTMSVATQMTVWWNETDGSGDYYQDYTTIQSVGNNLYCWIDGLNPGANTEMEVISSNEEVVSVNMINDIDAVLTMVGEGDATITVRPRYNPFFAKEYRIMVTDNEAEHNYVNNGVVDGMANLECSDCGKTKSIPVITSMSVWWNEESATGQFYSVYTETQDVGNQIYCLCIDDDDTPVVDQNIIFESSDPSVVSVEYIIWNDVRLTMNRAGEATISVYPKLNPELKKTYKITVKQNGIELNGYQISTTAEGFRTIYSVDSNINGQEVIESGLIYSIKSAPNEALYIGSTHEFVRNFASTDVGLQQKNYSSTDLENSYTMTLVFGDKTTGLFNTEWKIRAYAKLSDGTIVYSNIESMTICSIADYLYQNSFMPTEMGHNYLYTDILQIADNDYEEVEYNYQNGSNFVGIQ